MKERGLPEELELITLDLWALRIAQFGDKIASLEESWAGDRMDFRVGAMGQTVNGNLEVQDDHVRVEVQLPWILAMVAEKAKGFIQKQCTLMLEKK